MQILDSSAGSYPWLSAIQGFGNTDSNLGTGSSNYAVLCNATLTAPGATPTLQDSVFTDSTGVPSATESSIWLLPDGLVSGRPIGQYRRLSDRNDYPAYRWPPRSNRGRRRIYQPIRSGNSSLADPGSVRTVLNAIASPSIRKPPRPRQRLARSAYGTPPA